MFWLAACCLLVGRPVCAIASGTSRPRCLEAEVGRSTSPGRNLTLGGQERPVVVVTLAWASARFLSEVFFYTEQ